MAATKLPTKTKLRRFFIAPKGKGNPRLISFIKRSILARLPGP